MTLQNYLKWNSRVLIRSPLKLPMQRLHILGVLRNSYVPVLDLVTVYASIIRSVLEYCCPFYNTSIPTYLSFLINLKSNVTLFELSICIYLIPRCDCCIESSLIPTLISITTKRPVKIDFGSNKFSLSLYYTLCTVYNKVSLN